MDSIEGIINNSGSDISTCSFLNFIVNKLTPPPPSKGRAAFVREYDMMVKELKFEPNRTAKEWLDSLLKQATSNDKATVQAAIAAKKVAKPKMSPKKRRGGHQTVVVRAKTAYIRSLSLSLYIYIYIYKYICIYSSE